MNPRPSLSERKLRDHAAHLGRCRGRRSRMGQGLAFRASASASPRASCQGAWVQPIWIIPMDTNNTKNQVSGEDELRQIFDEDRRGLDALCDKACREIKECFDKGGTSSPQWVKDFCRNPLTLDRRDQILSSHPFWGEYRLRSGLDILFHAAHQAYVDLCAREAEIAPLDAGRKPFKSLDMSRQTYSAQKEVTAYCASVVGMQYIVKDIDKKKGVSALHNIYSEDCFASDVGELVGLLRNSILHARVSRPYTEITRHLPDEKGRTHYALVGLSKKDLIEAQSIHLKWAETKRGKTQKQLNEGKWEKAIRCFDRAAESSSILNDQVVPFSRIVETHFQQLQRAHTKASKWFIQNMSECEKDFFSLLVAGLSYTDEDKHHSSQMFIEHLEKSADLRIFLAEFFNWEEARNILCWPGTVEDQASYMMSLRHITYPLDEKQTDTLHIQLKRLRATLP